MAASPITWFPEMRILLATDHLDGDLGAHHGTQGATVAVSILLEGHGAEAAGIQLTGGNDVALFAGNDAEVAFLAKCPVDLDSTFQWTSGSPLMMVKSIRRFYPYGTECQEKKLPDPGDLKALQLDGHGTMEEIDGHHKDLFVQVRGDHNTFDAFERPVDDPGGLPHIGILEVLDLDTRFDQAADSVDLIVGNGNGLGASGLSQKPHDPEGLQDISLVSLDEMSAHRKR
jgi:hypothetical protein